MIGLLALFLAYLIGAIPFGYLVVRFTTGRDVRTEGSGNIGATNVLRTTGHWPAIATLALDIAKGFAAVWLTGWLTDGSYNWMALAALAVMAGHSYPLFLGFEGGKAVATFMGAFLYLTPEPLIAVLVVFVAIVALTGFISAGSLMAAATFPLGVWLILHPPILVLLVSVVAGGFIVWRHKENIERLRAGTENVFKWKRP